MEKLEIDIKWQQVNSKEKNLPLGCTWAELTIRAGESVISEHNDWLAQANNDRLFIPLYPLAEWIAVNWWSLLYEPLTPEHQSFSAEAYLQRHNIKYARSGFSLPDLYIQPQGLNVFIRWEATSLKYHKSRFLNSGYTSVDANEFEETLADFIYAVVTRLEKNSITGTLLQEEWSAIQNCSKEEREFCIAAATTGIDPYNYTEEEGDLIIQANELLPKAILSEFYAATNPLSIKKDIDAAQKTVALINNDTSDASFIRNIKGQINHRGYSSLPWKEGYNAAREVRTLLGLNGKAIQGFDELSNILHNNVEAIFKTTEAPITQSIRMIGGLNHNNSPVFLSTRHIKNERLEKFIFARGLYEYFYGNDFSIISDVNLESQKRNRAFAAEFLLPADALRKKISSEYVSEDHVDDLAYEFNISPKVIEHQILNHHIAEIEYM